MARAKRAVGQPTEGRRWFRQLEKLPESIGNVITEALEEYARDRKLALIAWYHDLPIWMLEAEPRNHRVRRIQVSACRDADGYLTLVATADMYELGPDGGVVRVVRSVPDFCVDSLRLPLVSWGYLEPVVEPAERWRKEIPTILDRVWKAAESLTEKDLEPIGSKR